MKLTLLDAATMLTVASPYLAILVILLHYAWRRARWRRNRHLGRFQSGFCPSSIALGMVFLLTQTFVQPSLRHTVEARLRVDVEDDDQGDPDSPANQLHRQLARIRRGEPVDTLTLRLKTGASAGRPGSARTPNLRHLHC